MKLHIKKDDQVVVIAGENKGKQGKVQKVDKAKNRAYIEGVNLVSRHTKPNSANPQGGIVKKEASVHISNLMLVDPKSGEPTRIRREKDEKGFLKRIAKKSGEEIK